MLYIMKQPNKKSNNQRKKKKINKTKHNKQHRGGGGKPDTNIFIIRHAERFDRQPFEHDKKLFNGDDTLNTSITTPTGLIHTMLTGELLQRYLIDNALPLNLDIHISPFLRARQTAYILTQYLFEQEHPIPSSNTISYPLLQHYLLYATQKRFQIGPEINNLFKHLAFLPEHIKLQIRNSSTLDQIYTILNNDPRLSNDDKINLKNKLETVIPSNLLNEHRKSKPFLRNFLLQLSRNSQSDNPIVIVAHAETIEESVGEDLQHKQPINCEIAHLKIHNDTITTVAMIVSDFTGEVVVEYRSNTNIPISLTKNWNTIAQDKSYIPFKRHVQENVNLTLY